MVEINEETRLHSDKLMKLHRASFMTDQTTISMNEEFVKKFIIRTPTSTRIVFTFQQSDGTCVGTVVHERPNSETIRGSCGADELLKEIQDPAVAENFKRYAARNEGCKCQCEASIAGILS